MFLAGSVRPPVTVDQSVRLSVQFFDDSGPTARFAVWALLVPDDSMSVDVLLGRDSWLLFATHTYTTDSPVSNRPLSGRLKLGHLDTDSGAQAYVDDPTQTGEAFRLYYAAEHVVSLSLRNLNKYM